MTKHVGVAMDLIRLTVVYCTSLGIGTVVSLYSSSAHLGKQLKELAEGFLDGG